MSQTISQALVARLGAELSGFKKGLRQAVNEAQSAGRKMQTNIGKASAAAKNLAKSVGLVALALTGLGALAVREFVQWEEALTGVAKTVDATDAEIQALGQTFVKMSEQIPVSANDLARLGEVAGQLGVELPNIKEFVETAAALGVSTNLMAEEAATGLARFSNVMGTAISNVDRLGSVIVDLGNNLATTEAEILDMALRITGAGKQVGLTEAQVLSFSAALSSLGIRSEAGGSAISRVFAEIASSVATGGERLKEFARIAGTTVESFRRQFREDGAEAVIQFVAGLDRVAKAGENVFGVLEKVEFQDIRVRDTLLRAAGGVDILRDAMELGNQAWEENVALTNEAQRFYDRTGARLAALRNKISNVAAEFGERLTPIIETSTSIVSGFLDQVREAGPAIASFAESAATAIPGMVQTVVRAVGHVGLALMSVVNFFRDNPLAGGFGLVGLVFLGPQGAAVLGTIGFIIDSLIDKLGGPQTVAEALNQKLEDAIDLQAQLLQAAETIEGRGPSFQDPAEVSRLREEAESLSEVILGIRRTISGLSGEDFIAFGNEGAMAFDKINQALTEAFETMTRFKAELSLGGGPQEAVEETVEAAERLKLPFENVVFLTDDLTAKLDMSKTKAGQLGLEFRQNVQASVLRLGASISSSIGNALGNVLAGVESITEGFKRLARVIVTQVVAALGRAAAISAIMNPLFRALNLPLPEFASGGIVQGPGTAGVPIMAHPGEVVLSREAVASLGGAFQANQINRGEAPALQAGPQSVAVSVDFPDPGSLPNPIDFGVIASQPALMRLFSEMLKQARWLGTVGDA